MDLAEALDDASVVGTASSIPDFVLDEDLRVIAVPSNGVVLGVEGDKDTNTVSFSMPKVYRGCDLSTFTCRVSYINPNNDTGFYAVTDMKESADNADLLTFTWLVDDVAVRYRGTVRFAVNLRDLDGSTVKRAFNSTVAEVQSLEGLPTPTSQPASNYEDLIARIGASAGEIARNSLSGLTWAEFA